MEENTGDVPLPPSKPVVGIIYNGKKGMGGATPDSEAEYDSIDTVRAISAAIESGGYKTVILEGDETLPNALEKNHIDIAFNIAEGLRGRGREAEIPALMNILGIPFTGSDETALCVALDKAMCKRVLSTFGIKTPGYAVVEGENDITSVNLRFPVIVKPNAEGSSKGIQDACIASSAEELNALLKNNLRLYGEPMLVEEYIHGREFTVGILGNGKKARVFSPMEIIFKDSNNFSIYSYGVKQDYQKYISYKCPPDISPEEEAEMTRAALLAFNAIGCRDFSRVDFRMDASGQIYFIEMNPLPGLAPGYSDYPMLAEFCGVAYNELVLGVLRAALDRPEMGAVK